MLIATEAGGEGINLQFCNHMINYDLPWNPMRLEQRIGRIHRLGQKNDVHIYNLATKHTVEEHILKLLYEKINLFERVIGELDEILTRINMQNIDAHIEEIFAESKSEGEIRIKMENLTSIIDFAKRNEAEVQDYASNMKFIITYGTFFKANDCEILRRSPHRLDVQLTIEMDKRLMNRPFYWHYLEKTGGIPNPMQLSLITDPNHAEEEGELIHYGSPRLHQIFQTTKELGSYIRLFEDTKGSGTAHTPLHPWLGVNVKVCYQCDRKKRYVALNRHSPDFRSDGEKFSRDINKDFFNTKNT